MAGDPAARIPQDWGRCLALGHFLEREFPLVAGNKPPASPIFSCYCFFADAPSTSPREAGAIFSIASVSATASGRKQSLFPLALRGSRRRLFISERSLGPHLTNSTTPHCPVDPRSLNSLPLVNYVASSTPCSRCENAITSAYCQRAIRRDRSVIVTRCK